MPIRLDCTCGQGIRAKDGLEGKTIRCPKCNKALLVPGLPHVVTERLDRYVERLKAIADADGSNPSLIGASALGLSLSIFAGGSEEQRESNLDAIKSATTTIALIGARLGLDHEAFKLLLQIHAIAFAAMKGEAIPDEEEEPEAAAPPWLLIFLLGAGFLFGLIVAIISVVKK